MGYYEGPPPPHSPEDAQTIYNALIFTPDRVPVRFLPEKAWSASGHDRVDQTLAHFEEQLLPRIEKVQSGRSLPGSGDGDIIWRATGHYALFFAAAQEAAVTRPNDEELCGIVNTHLDSAREIFAHTDMGPIREAARRFYFRSPYMIRLLLDVEHPDYTGRPGIGLWAPKMFSRDYRHLLERNRRELSGLVVRNLVGGREKIKVVGPTESNDERFAAIMEARLWQAWGEGNITDELVIARARRLLKSVRSLGTFLPSDPGFRLTREAYDARDAARAVLWRYGLRR